MTITITAPQTAEAPLTKTTTVEMKAKIDRLRELRTIKNDVETEAKALSAELIEFAGEAKKLMWGTTVLGTIVDSKSVTANTKLLAEAYPEAFEATVTVKPYKQFR